jgi:hypothetical protein
VKRRKRGQSTRMKIGNNVHSDDDDDDDDFDDEDDEEWKAGQALDSIKPYKDNVD